jgi:predicted PurR-regulated permease PerM
MSEGVYRYVRVKTIVSLGTAFVTAVVLFTLGVPGWLLWSALTFILNYVPLIGGLIATLPPCILAVLLLDPTVAIVLIIILIVNQQVWGQFIENKMFGTSLDISPIVILLVTVFWFWLWGIMGMVLAIPMAVIAKIILSNIPETRPISILLSEKAPAIEEE